MPLDIAIGILSALFVSHQFSIPLTTGFILLSILFALLPDLDMATYPLEKRFQHAGFSHRDIFHYPLILIPLGSGVAFLFGGYPYAALFVLTTSLHFLHDSIGIGRGVKWLFPFSKTAYSFIYLYSRINPRGLWQPIFRFRNTADHKQFRIEHGDEQWFRNIYLRFHPYALVEFLFLFLSILFLILFG